PFHPHGHALLHKVAGKEYIYFGNPHPLVRVVARPDAIEKLSEYEAFTCLTPRSRLKAPGKDGVEVNKAMVERESSGQEESGRADRNGTGRPRWGWKKDAPPILPVEQQRLIAAGKLRANEALHPLRDVETDKPVQAHAGNVAWNEYRQAWVMITGESGGQTSNLGEIWCAEAPTPLGPWVYARRVVTHDKTSFYNPAQHPALAQEGGRLIYFEGTHSIMFSGLTVPTPRYEYNQIMYRLDLADPRLALPAPIFGQTVDGKDRLACGAEGTAKNTGVAFFAMKRPAEGLVAVYAAPDARGATILSLERPVDAAGEAATPFFYALPVDQKDPPPAAAPLYAWTTPDGARLVYSTAKTMPAPLARSKAPLCLVWRSPLADVAIAWK
ncbi:MAG TPA: hypothetical protein VGJ26_13165, partial [Pirellulales bacterium]